MREPQTVRAGWSGRAIGIPAFAAGLMYLIALLLAVQMLEPAESWPLDGDFTELLAVIPFAGMAMAVGALLAVVPVTLGVTTMAWIGKHNIGARHPAMWALAGAAGAAGVVALLGVWETPTPPALALIFTGAGCAALARRYVRWPQTEE